MERHRHEAGGERLAEQLFATLAGHVELDPGRDDERNVVAHFAMHDDRERLPLLVRRGFLQPDGPLRVAARPGDDRAPEAERQKPRLRGNVERLWNRVPAEGARQGVVPRFEEHARCAVVRDDDRARTANLHVTRPPLGVTREGNPGSRIEVPGLREPPSARVEHQLEPGRPRAQRRVGVLGERRTESGLASVERPGGPWLERLGDVLRRKRRRFGPGRRWVLRLRVSRRDRAREHDRERGEEGREASEPSGCRAARVARRAHGSRSVRGGAKEDLLSRHTPPTSRPARALTRYGGSSGPRFRPAGSSPAPASCGCSRPAGRSRAPRPAWR